MNFKDGYGTCKWCGQARVIMKAPENATQDELDRIASDECTCDGANEERKIREMISAAESSILKVVTKRAPGAAQILQAGVEQVARGYAKKVSVNVDGMLTASMYRSVSRWLFGRNMRGEIMSRSIIPEDEPGECYICSHYGRPPEALREECANRGVAAPQQIEEHHILGGPLRKLSEHYGLKVHLCTYHHTSGSEAVHNNRTWDMRLKQIGQKAFEERYSHGMWMQVFKRDYLAEEPPDDTDMARESERGTDDRSWTTGAPSGEKKMAQVNECVTDCGNLKCRYNAANIKEKNVFLVFMRDKKGCEGYKRVLKKAERKEKAVDAAGKGENDPKKKAGAPEKPGKITPKNGEKIRTAAGGAKEKKSRAAAGRAKTKKTGNTAKRTQAAGRKTARKEGGK